MSCQSTRTTSPTDGATSELRAVVVGAGGYLGGWIFQRLSESGHQVIPHMRTRPHDSADSAIVGDLRSDDTIGQICAAEPDILIHAVSLDHRASEGPVDDVMRVNVDPLLAILKRLDGRPLPRLVYLSTVQVYGRQRGKIDEATSPAPANVYGLTHLMCEQIGHLYRDRAGSDVYNLRIGNSCGIPCQPNANCWSLVVNELCKMARETGTIRLQSDGSPQRDFLDVRDVAAAVSVFTHQKAPASAVYHVVSSHTRSILDAARVVVEQAEALLGKTIAVLGPEGQDLLTEPVASEKSISFTAQRLRDLGWRCENTLDETIKGLLSYD